MHLGLGLGLTRLSRAAGGAPALTPLILDTDFGDRDDATVLAYLNYALDNGYAINLLGIGCDERSQYNAGGVSSCMAHFGRNATRIGKNKTGLSPTDGFDGGGSYGGLGLYPRRVLRVGDAEEVVAMYRQILTAAADNSVVFVSIGWLNNVADLLASAGDGISPLTGEQLVAAKVNRWHCMGGAYPSGGEANFQNAPADANYAVANWPATVPVYFIGNAISNGVFPTAAIAAMPLDSPIRQRAAGAGFNGLWDTCALMSAIETSEAVRPAAGSWYSWTRGTNAVNASTGVNTFTNGVSGPHYYATLLQSNANLLAYLTPFCTHYRATPYTGVPLDTFAFAEGGGATTTSANGIVATLSNSAGEAVTSRSGEIGSTWAYLGAYASSAVLMSDASRIRNNFAGLSAAYASGLPASADYSVSADVTVLGTPSTSNLFAGVTARQSTSAATEYLAVYYTAPVSQWRLFKSVAGTFTQLGASHGDVLSGGSTRRVTLAVSGTTIRLLVDGIEAVRAADSAVAAAGRAGVIFNLAATNSSGPHLDNFAAYDSQPVVNRLAVFDGDSLTQGVGSTTGNNTVLGLNYPGRVTTAIAGANGLRALNFGVGGQTISSMSSDAVAQVDSLFDAITYTKGQVLFVAGGTNDIRLGSTARQTVDALWAYCDARRSAGWKVVCNTLLPAEASPTYPDYPPDFNTTRNSANALIRAEWAAHADALADWAADAVMGPDGAQTDTTYFADKVHPTDAGYSRLAVISTAAAAPFFVSETVAPPTRFVADSFPGAASLSAVPGKLRCLRTGSGFALAPTNDLFRFFPRMSRTFFCEFTTGALTGGGEEVIFGGDRDSGGWWRFGKTTAGAWLVTFNGGADITGGAVASNTLYKAAIVFDGIAGTAKLFVNGTQVGSTYTTTSEGIAATLGSWGFGRGAGASDNSHIATADIDTFSVYAGAASDAQAQALTA